MGDDALDEVKKSRSLRKGGTNGDISERANAEVGLEERRNDRNVAVIILLVARILNSDDNQ